ncbi:Permease [Bacillus thuringiensis serovar pulsiensis BGSC 4CC1]|nr:Permease [Bacillus thuringiensis serovar pulsiensis BGSC 4CC1]
MHCSTCVMMRVFFIGHLSTNGPVRNCNAEGSKVRKPANPE